MKLEYMQNIRKKRQKLWLFALPVFLVLLVFGVNSWQHRCRDEIEVSVPFNSNPDLHEIIVIKRLSSEIKKCPRAKIYKVEMSGNKIYTNTILIYDRQKQRLTEKALGPMGNGFTSWYGNISDDTILRAASQSAHFDDMKHYGGKLFLD